MAIIAAKVKTDLCIAMGCLAEILGVIGVFRLWGTQLCWWLVALMIFETIYVQGLKRMYIKDGRDSITGRMIVLGTSLQVAIAAIGVSSFFR